MANSQKIPFVIGSDAGFSKKSNDTSLINLFLHVEPAGSKDKYVILNTDGLSKIMDLPYKIYGVYTFLDVSYVVTSDKLYSVDIAAETYTELGDVSINKQCIFANNGIEFVFVGGNSYSYKPSTTILKDLSSENGFYPADSVAYLDGYFIFNRSGTGQFFISELLATTFDPLMYATAESNPDNLLNVVSTSRELWLFGEHSTEVWYDAGGSDLPFARISGAINNIGCLQDTAKRLREHVYLIGDDYKAYQTSGYAMACISNGSIEKILNDNKDKDISTFVFMEYGHFFYVVTIEDVGTYVYDTTTAQWHNRKSGEADTWKVEGISEYDKNLIAYSDKSLYFMSINNYDEDGENIKREIVSLPINKSVNRFRINELQMDMDVGFNVPTPIMYLRMTKDAGLTWSGRYKASIGKVGESKARVRWLRLGQFFDATAKFYTYDPIPIRIISLDGKFS